MYACIWISKCNEHVLFQQDCTFYGLHANFENKNAIIAIAIDIENGYDWLFWGKNYSNKRVLTSNYIILQTGYFENTFFHNL